MSISDISLHVIKQRFQKHRMLKNKTKQTSTSYFVCLLNATDCAESDQPPGQAHQCFSAGPTNSTEKHTASPD